MKKAHQRQIKIIERLYRHQDWLSLKELSEDVKASVYSIRDDLTLIQERFVDQVKIEEQNMSVRAHFRTDITPDTCRRDYIRTSLGYRLLATILIHNPTSIEEVAEIIYSSRSTLYRSIPDVNTSLLAPYAIHLSTRPFILQGEEWAIRCFYVDLFQSAHHPFEWPFDTIDQQAVERIIDLANDLFNLNLATPVINQAKIHFVVSLLRNAHHPIHINQSTAFTPYIAQLMPYLKTGNYLNWLQSLIKRPIDEQDLLQLFFPLLIHAMTLNESYSDLISDLMTDLAKQQKLSSFSSASHIPLLQHLTNHLPPPIGLTTGTLAEVTQFNHLFKSQHPDFYSELVKCSKQIIQSLNDSLPPFYQEHMIFYLITHWPQLVHQLENRKRLLNILVVSHLSPAHAQYISDDLLFNFPNEITTQISPDPWDEATIRHTHYDLIISTYDFMEPSEQLILNIGTFPHDHMYHFIQQLLNKG